MNQIYDPPNGYGFGLEFDYDVWTAGTQIDLVNVPWNNDYRDTVHFGVGDEGKKALNDYIDSLSGSGIKIDNLSYVKPNTPIRVDMPHSRALRYNYLRATNPVQPVEGNDFQKAFYYFILDAKYIAPNTTELIIQLDVWQTFGYDVEFGRCFVERGHIGIANSNQFNNNGRDYLTVPEGIDLGSDYMIYGAPSKKLMTDYDVLVLSTTDLINSGGTVSDPVLYSAPGSTIQGLPSGATAYAFYNIQAFKNWLNSVKSKPWVTQGIISVTLIPDITEFNPNYQLPESTDSPKRIDDLGWGQTPRKRAMRLRSDFRDWFKNNIPSRYRHLLKFLTSPYFILEVTTYSGNTLILKPELWKSEHATFVEHISIMPPNQRWTFHPWAYNAVHDPGEEPADKSTVFLDTTGERLGTAIGLTNFPTFPVVNNMAISYLASNANSLRWQAESADWSQQRALAGAQAGYDIATGAMGLATDLTQIGIAADQSQTAIGNRANQLNAGINAAANFTSGLAGGAVFGPGPALGGILAGGAQGVAGIVTAAVSADAANQSLATRTSAALASNNRQIQQSALVRDTNKGLADWSARGDYANTIAGINAKVQDAKMTQPSMAGTFGGDAFNIVNGFDQLEMRMKGPDLAALTRIGDYWLRYGYAIQRFMTIPQSLKVMTKFTYWKCLETYISSSTVPESYKQAIRGILEKGVTVWTNPNDIGKIDIADNKPLEGISY